MQGGKTVCSKEGYFKFALGERYEWKHKTDFFSSRLNECWIFIGFVLSLQKQGII